MAGMLESVVHSLAGASPPPPQPGFGTHRGGAFGLRPCSWYSKNAVKDVGFMVSYKRRPQQEERLFYCSGAPGTRKVDSRYGPRNGKVVFRREGLRLHLPRRGR